MRRVCIAAAAAIAAAALWAPAASAAGEPWKVGVAVRDITPPTDHSLDPQAIKTCAVPPLTGPRPWAFTEPYQDLNGDGDFDYPEPFCDANQNGRYDGMYLSGAVDHQAKVVHDPIDVRAVAFSDGTKTAVVASVVSQGLFENYSHMVRDQVKARVGNKIDDIIMSANHNESSPDSIGIYGAPDNGVTGSRSGINDYYMEQYLVPRVVDAIVEAYVTMAPANIYVRRVGLPASLRVRLSHNFPTTNDDESPAAIDPQVRVLQARDASGKPIVTLMNLAAHNQQIGHGGSTSYDVSSDWPGYFQRKLDTTPGFGKGVFLVGANGSEEDPETVPKVSDTSSCKDACRLYAQAQATGEGLANLVMSAAPQAEAIRPGSLLIERHEFLVPLENNLFKAAASAGLFGKRQGYASDRVTVATPATAAYLRTEVGVLDLGPDLQFMANPGESFPALIFGSPWGIEDAPCPSRPNPQVPDWHARARFRFQIGLANDLIGYLLPAWAYTSIPGAFAAPPECMNNADDVDSKGHQHKLETEGVGPTASNMVADELSKLLDKRPDPAARIRLGRFVMPDGKLSRRAVGPGGQTAVGIWVAPAGSSTLGPTGGTVVALPGIGFFGGRPVDRTGTFMDYDGGSQTAPDITTRGMLVRDASGSVVERFYLDVYPAVTAAPLGPTAPPAKRGATPRLTLRVIPRTPRVGRRVPVAFGANAVIAGVRRGVPGVRIRFAGRTLHTDARGWAARVLMFPRAGRYYATAARRGFIGVRLPVLVRR